MTPQRDNPYPDRLAPLEELVNVLEVEDAARRKLDRAVYGRIAAGLGSETTLRRNREFFDRMTFRRRVLVDVRKMDLSVDLFGQKLYTPILVGPMARHQRVHAEGELATAQGAGAAKTILIVSRDSSVPFDRIASRAAASVWYQCYPENDPARLRDAVHGAVAAGAKAVCLTVGAPYEPFREADHHNRSAQDPARWPPHLRQRSNPQLSWDLLPRLREWAGVPVLLKGILSPEEARAAVDRGVSGIVVSNHGARVLDGAPATIEILPQIAEAVGGRAPILIDGGFRRGTDILKALALGAKAVLIGRPILWGLAAYGADGVRVVLEMLQSELALAMGLCGKPNLAALDRALVKIHRW